MKQETNRNKPRLLRQLHRDLVKRRSIVGGFARESLDQELLQTVTELGTIVSNSQHAEDANGLPSRRVAKAMTRALYTLPFVGKDYGNQTLSPWSESQIFDNPEVLPPPPTASSISAALGLSFEEIEAIREELDQRFCSLLSQQRTLIALFHHFDLPEASFEPLFQQLFPVVPQRFGPDSVTIVGASLYSVVEQEASYPNEAIYLPWVTENREGLYPPLHTFKSEIIDEALLRSLGKALGVDQKTLNQNLRRSIVLLPTNGADRLRSHDLWRNSGAASMTTLGEGYTSAVSPFGEVTVEELDLKSWLIDADGGLSTDHIELAFSGLLFKRLAPMLHYLHAELVASLAQEQVGPSATRIAANIDDLGLYDISNHVATVAQPLIDWVSSETAVSDLCAISDAVPSAARVILETVSAAWRSHLDESWLHSIRSASSMHSLLTSHLIGSKASVRDLLNRPPINGFEHKILLLLFTGFLLSDTSLETLSFGGADSDMTWPPSGAVSTDEIGQWFWPLLQRVLLAT